MKPPKPKLIDCWDLFLRDFHEGDEVVFICGEDEFYWGRLIFPKSLVERDNGFILRDVHGRERAFLWDDVAFMAHDGFPVKQLKGADGSPSVFDESHRSSLRQMAGIFAEDLRNNDFGTVKEILEQNEHEAQVEEEHQRRMRRRLTIGDPYLIENVTVDPFLVYLRDFPEYGWLEQCVVLRADDGAVGMLYPWNNYEGWCVAIVDYEKVA